MVTNTKGKFYQSTTLNAGSQSIAHGLGFKPEIFLAESEDKAAGIAKGTPDATELLVNPASTGIIYTIFAM